jgi:hypothetical protein
MRLRTRALTMATAACAVGGLLIGTPLSGAAAEGPDVDAIVFAGVAGGLSPALPPASAFPAGLLQTGTFGFGGGCLAGASTDLPPTLPEVATTCTITSSGTYLDVVCGTGTATGTSTISSDADGVVTGAYTIVFVAGVGVLQNALLGNPPTSPNPGLSPEGAAIGVIDIVPTNAASGGCVIAPVDSFNVTGLTLAAG